MVVASGTLYTVPKYHRTNRILIAAKYSNFKLTIVDYVPGKTNTEASFLAKFPDNAVPVFESNDHTCLFDASAIAFYVGNEQLRGGQQQHLVTQWTNWADAVILPAMATWVYPCLGVIQYNKGNAEKAKETIHKALDHLNKYLADVTYLVGERLSQADITVFTVLQPLLEYALDAEARRPFPHLLRWFTTLAHQPQVTAVLGEVKLCDKAGQFDAKKFAELHPKGADAGKAGKESGGGKKPAGTEHHAATDAGGHKEDKKKREKKTSGGDQQQSKEKQAKKPKEAAPADEEDDIADAEQKEDKDPFGHLPKGTFNMDEFKRTYSNQDIATIALPHFWEKFDPSAYSIWFCEYKFPEELRLIFMSCNLITGMFQRLERMHKNAFGSMCLFGENNKSTISGVWVWRGLDLAFLLHSDLQVDYESYEWRKLDPAAEETKTLVKEYFLQAGDFGGKKLNQGKIFK